MVDIYNLYSDFKILEVAFKSKDNTLNKLICTVKSIENDRLVIAANNKKNKDVFAEVGVDLKLYIYTDNGIYSSDSKVLELFKGSFTTEYTISYPTQSKHSQRREYFRADIHVDFVMKVVTDNEQDEVDTISGKAKNICGKGLSFLSKKPFPAYDSIDVRLLFPDKSILTSAELVYSRPTQVNNKLMFIHAFTFTDISRYDIDYIVKKCFLFQLDHKKKQ